MAQAGDYETPNQITRQVRLREASFDTGENAQIVVDLNGNLILANNKARENFSLGTRDLGKPLQNLEISYRPVDLRSLIERAYGDHKAVSVGKVEKRFPDGNIQYFDVFITPLIDQGGDISLGTSITFEDRTNYYMLKDELERSKHDLKTAYKELQSTNEELETTNEELQSTNEELQTMNEEMRQRTDELNSVNSFLESVFRGMHRGVVVANATGKILVWNKGVEDMWGLLSDEVMGKDFFNLDIGLPVAELRADANQIVQGGPPRDVSLNAISLRGKAVKVRVTISSLGVTVKATGKSSEGLIFLMEESNI